jgi:hypothetical protein
VQPTRKTIVRLCGTTIRACFHVTQRTSVDLGWIKLEVASRGKIGREMKVVMLPLLGRRGPRRRRESYASNNKVIGKSRWGKDE